MDYPDPTVQSTPRPYAVEDGSDNATQSPVAPSTPSASSAPAPSPFASHISSFWPATSTASRGYLTLNDYFQLGSASLQANAQPSPSETDPSIGPGRTALLEDYRSPYSDLTWNRDPQENYLGGPAPQRSERKSTRGRGRANGQKAPRRGWKKLIKGTEHAALFKTPRLGRKAGGRDMRGGGRQRGVRSTADPGPEFKKMQGKAMEAWIRQDYEAAEQLALEAVTINPEVYEAHALISDALLAQGRDYEALLAKHVGAVVARDPEIYLESADKWVEMYMEGQGDDCLDRALDGYREALKPQQSNCRIRRGMRDVYVLQQDFQKAKLISRSIARFEPGDLENVQKYAEFCGAGKDVEDMTRALEAYEEAFRLHQDEETIGDEDAQWTYLNVYIDLLDRLEKHNEAIVQLKSKARWFLGRKNESFWDRISDDDREFDSGNDRRNYVWEYQQGRASRDMARYGEGLPIELRVKLGVLRLKMGENHYDEAKRHLNYVLRLQDEVDDLHDLFVVSAEALRGHQLIDSALDFYEALKLNPEFLSVENLMNMAECYQAVEKSDEAIQCYLTVIEEDDEHVQARVQLAKLYESQGLREEAQEIADEVIQLGHEKTLQKEKILLKRKKPGRKSGGVRKQSSNQREQQAAEDLPALAPLPADPDHSNALASIEEKNTPEIQPSPDWKTGRTVLKNLDRLQQQKEIIHGHYAVVKELWPALEDGDEDIGDRWSLHANAMLDEFRSMRALFPKRERYNRFAGLRGLADADAMEEMDALKERLRGDGDVNDEEPQTSDSGAAARQIYEIPFSEWHRLAFDLAIHYARRAEQEKCYEIIHEVLEKATVFRRDPELVNLAVVLSIYCGLLFDDSLFLSEPARHYIVAADYRSDMSYQLMAALVRLAKGEDSAYQDSSLDKFIFRTVRIRDHATMPDEMRKLTGWGDGQEESRLRDRQARLGDIDDGLDAGLLTLHGHNLASTKTGRYGPSGMIHPMSYLFRALALQPDNLTINLTIAVIFLKGSAYRTSSNRQFGFTQALSFFYRYYDRRVADGKASHVQEAEFNLGRMWHQLGLTHLAVSSYEKVLQMSELVQMESLEEDKGSDFETEDFAKEAAFSLQQMFAIAGNMEAAQAITEKWLVL